MILGSPIREQRDTIYQLSINNREGVIKNIFWLKEIDRSLSSYVGEKATQIGELIQSGVNVPSGFVISSAVYFNFLKHTGLDKKIDLMLRDLDTENTRLLQKQSTIIEKTILTQKFPESFEKELKETLVKLNSTKNSWAVRFSPAMLDPKHSPFAGQQKAFLNIKNETQLKKAILQMYAVIFSPSSIYYRSMHQFGHFEVGVAVIIQKMVNAQKSGILFTINPITSNQNEMMIEAGLGLGGPINEGTINPDQYILDKQSGETIRQVINFQPWKLRLGANLKHTAIAGKARSSAKLSPDEISTLFRWSKNIEKRFSLPQNVEWGFTNEILYFFESAPIIDTPATLPSQHKRIKGLSGALGHEIAHGVGASLGIETGPVHLVHNPDDLTQIKNGEILVTEMTKPTFIPALKKVRAIITDTGGATSHAALIARELGVPAVVGTGQTTHILRNNQIVTVDGTHGVIYKGQVSHPAIKSHHFHSSHPFFYKKKRFTVPITGTKIYLNLSDPDQAEKLSQLPADGVGLLRAEFMIASFGEHPKAMIASGRTDEYIDALEEGMRKISVAFSPRPVIYRLSDFKTNEYRGLKGGSHFEPHEANPMIGFRGALRYTKEPDVVMPELIALKRAQDKYGIDNLHIMVPFVRTTNELKNTLELIKKAGLKQGPDFKIWMMVEVPSNVFLLDDFIAMGLDGISIGSNDLTQLILGVDRDSSNLSEHFDERNKAVKIALNFVIKKCREHHITSSVCGNAVSVYPEIVELVVNAGVTSLSIAPDMIMQTRKLVSSIEKQIVLAHSLE